MTISFPDVSGLSDGYQEIIDGKLYTLNKTSDTVFYWSASLAENPDDRYVNITGDNMTGALGGVTNFAANNVDATTVEATNLTDGTETKPVAEVLDGFATQVLTEANVGAGTTNVFSGTIIPSNARRIKILFNKLKTNGVQNLLVRFRTTTGTVTTGYSSMSADPAGGTGSATNNTGFVIYRSSNTQFFTGHMEFTRMSPTSTTWIASHMLFDEDETFSVEGSGILNSYTGNFNEIVLTNIGSNNITGGTISIFVST